jgi:hypothetical protein
MAFSPMPENEMMSFRGTAARCGVSRRLLPVAALLVLAACNGLGEAMTAHQNVVARAAGKELRVDEAARILAANPEIPPDPEVVRALADLWVDYALLASAVAEDTTLAALDLAGFVNPIREQAIIGRLRDQVVQVDTVIDDTELDRRWALEGPGAEISARHILLREPTDATQAQRDSVMAEAEELRARAVAGEPFDELAREYSQDPGSAVRGGDLGFFGRGRMVQPFEDAAFALQPGEVSPVVESPFGYHIIVVDERRQQELGEDREPFRQWLVQRSVEEAELTYLESLTEGANVRISQAGAEVVREIAGRPGRSLRGRQAERAIATYDGGEYTAGEFSRFIGNQPPQVQSAFATATGDQLDAGIRQLVQMKLLLAEAERRDIRLTPEEEAELRAEARAMITELVQATGFAEAARVQIDPAELDEYVKSLIEGVVTGEQPFIPLGQLGVSLREAYSHEINEGAFNQVVQRLEEVRARQPAIQMPGQFDPSMPVEPTLPVEPAIPAPGSQLPVETPIGREPGQD